MKQYAIRRMYSYFETNSDDIKNGSFDQKLEEPDEELKLLLKKYGLKHLSQDTRFIAQKKMSACICDCCGNLMINRDKNPAGLDNKELWADLDMSCNAVILDGGNYEGKTLCMECLPIEHRWGCFS